MALETECRTAKFQRVLRWRKKNGFRAPAYRSLFHDWAVRQFIHENLYGPVSNIKSCLDPSIMVQYEPKLYVALALRKAVRAKEQ